ncbi:MAG TPA: hypothetical protein VEW48_11610 [Thermoanaerobaculia bacterium]|nr:hypothetical protein [Thermoanaerobaculia bacterium]
MRPEVLLPQTEVSQKEEKMEKRRNVIGFAWAVTVLLTVASAQAQAQEQERAQEPVIDGPAGAQVTTTYAAKFICGVQAESGFTFLPETQAGRYSTKVNVHNNTGILIQFRKKIIRLRGGESATDPQAKVFEELKSDQAMEVVCKDIYKLLNVPLNGQMPPPYMEGFVILEVYAPPNSKMPLDPLDVEGIYTYRGDLPTGSTSTNSGASIAVVVYPAKNNSHFLQ